MCVMGDVRNQIINMWGPKKLIHICEGDQKLIHVCGTKELIHGYEVGGGGGGVSMGSSNTCYTHQISVQLYLMLSVCF